MNVIEVLKTIEIYQVDFRKNDKINGIHMFEFWKNAWYMIMIMIENAILVK